MIDLVKKFFSGPAESGAQDTKRGEAHDIRVAVCALLLEMAAIDGEFLGAEKKNIIEILRNKYGLSDEHIDALIETSNAELKGSVDLWQFTNLINQNYSIEEKSRIIEMVWEIAYIDGRLDQHEDYLAHKLANLLRLTHKKLIEAKLKVIRPDNDRPA